MPNSLLAKVLEAKYYHGSSILSSTLGNRPSYAWRSIYMSLQEVKSGFFWQVNTQSTIKILSDKWGGFQPITLTETYIDNHDNPLLCNEFMNESGDAWDATKVMQVFNSTDAAAILSCPIAKNHTDILIWANHSSGLYSVRSAYHWLMRQQHNDAPPSTLWNKLSKLKTLPKIRIFIWRAAREALPVGTRLLTAGPRIFSNCMECMLVSL
ncbi:hypothetical protein V6N11_056948 [Hibiscus sabdariffa]|uniref:Reverse transcriptase zinc-binding domain-containing protein n=1 Tax=Hibiscus sabdariffa TaxID=183260 RepID=A0ABR2T5T6_9ROSI